MLSGSIRAGRGARLSSASAFRTRSGGAVGRPRAGRTHQQHEQQRGGGGQAQHRPGAPPAGAALQQRQQRPGVGGPLGRVEAQAAVDDPRQRRVGDPVVPLRLRRREDALAVDRHLRRQYLRRLLDPLDQFRGAPRRLAGEHLVGDRAQGVHVPAGVRRRLLLGRVDLVGRHVEEGAQRRGVVGGEVRLAEVGDQRVRRRARLRRVEQNVLGLEVAVVDAAAVDGGHRAGHLREEAHRRAEPLARRQRAGAALQPDRQRAGVGQLHDVVRPPARRALPDLFDQDDAVAALDRLEQPDLAEHRGPVRVAGREELDRDALVRQPVLGLVDGPEGAGAQFAEEEVALGHVRAGPHAGVDLAVERGDFAAAARVGAGPGGRRLGHRPGGRGLRRAERAPLRAGREGLVTGGVRRVGGGRVRFVPFDGHYTLGAGSHRVGRRGIIEPADGDSNARPPPGP
jgi:hypothetical protein